MLNRVHPGTLRDAADDRTGFRRGSTYALNAFPTVYVHRLAADLRFYAENNIVFAQYDCVTGHWGTNGLNYYVLARLLWDPWQDVDALVAEYCARDSTTCRSAATTSGTGGRIASDRFGARPGSTSSARPGRSTCPG